MKKVLKLLCVLFVTVFLSAALLGTYTPVEASGTGYYLDGVDYTRLTQTTSKASSLFNATLVLGPLEMKGFLRGTQALTMEEINEIVLQQMKAMGLNLEQVKILSSVGDDLTRKQYIELGKKLAVAASEYIPVKTPGASTVVKTIVYGYDPTTPIEDIATTKIKNEVEARVENALANGAKDAAGKVTKVGGGFGMVGFVLNSISAAQDLLDDTEYDKFCKELEKQYQKISEFYIKCSQKLNDAVAEKNLDNKSIVFDQYSKAETTAVLLGVDGVKMRYRVEGELKSKVNPDEYLEPGDNSGTYEGDLTLTVEAYDLKNDFDAVFAEKCSLWTRSVGSDWCQILARFPGRKEFRDEFLSKYIFTVNTPTILKRKLVGHFKLTITQNEIKGKITPTLSGAFNNKSDEIDFLYKMTFGEEYIADEKYSNDNGITWVNLGKPLCQWHLEGYVHGGNEINSLFVQFVGNEAYRHFMKGQSVGDIVYGSSGGNMLLTQSELGTIWYYLESAPKIEISPMK